MLVSWPPVLPVPPGSDKSAWEIHCLHVSTDISVLKEGAWSDQCVQSVNDQIRVRDIWLQNFKFVHLVYSRVCLSYIVTWKSVKYESLLHKEAEKCWFLPASCISEPLLWTFDYMTSFYKSSICFYLKAKKWRHRNMKGARPAQVQTRQNPIMSGISTIHH